MNTSLIFVVLSAVIATSISAAISSSPVFAATTSCFHVSKTKDLCTSSDSTTWQECTKRKDGTWSCKQVFAVPDDSLPTDLKDAVDAGQEQALLSPEAAKPNDTKIFEEDAVATEAQPEGEEEKSESKIFDPPQPDTSEDKGTEDPDN